MSVIFKSCKTKYFNIIDVEIERVTLKISELYRKINDIVEYCHVQKYWDTLKK